MILEFEPSSEPFHISEVELHVRVDDLQTPFGLEVSALRFLVGGVKVAGFM